MVTANTEYQTRVFETIRYIRIDDIEFHENSQFLYTLKKRSITSSGCALCQNTHLNEYFVNAWRNPMDGVVTMLATPQWLSEKYGNETTHLREYTAGNEFKTESLERELALRQVEQNIPVAFQANPYWIVGGKRQSV